MTPSDWFRSRFGCSAVMGMAVVFAVVLVFRFRNPVLAVFVLLAVVALRMILSWRTPAMKVMVSVGGIGWTHATRGPGLIVWRDVGALIVRQAGARGDLAVYLVGRGPASGTLSNSFMMTAADLGLDASGGEAGLRAFVEDVLPRLPADVTLDRETRSWLETWGIRHSPG